jgi:hypothetical protein
MDALWAPSGRTGKILASSLPEHRVGDAMTVMWAADDRKARREMGHAIDHRGERGADGGSTSARGATWRSGTDPTGDRSPAVGAASLLLSLSKRGLGA